MGDEIPGLFARALTFDQPDPERRVEQFGYPVMLEAVLVFKEGEFVALEDIVIKEKPSLLSA